MISKNRTLSKLLEKMEQKRKVIKTPSDILDIVQMAISYPEKIKYNNRDCQISLILGGIAEVIYYMILQHYHDVGGEFLYYSYSLLFFLF